MFKSYADAKVKPPQYSKNYADREIDEYLTKRQKSMKKYRKGRDVPGAMFDERWSGFNLQENSNPLVKRRLNHSPKVENIELNVKDSSSMQSWLLFGVIGLSMTSLILLSRYFARIHKKSITDHGDCNMSNLEV